MPFPDLEQYIRLFRPENNANIKSFIKADSPFPENASALAMDIGGSNFRIGRVFFDGSGEASIKDFKSFPMPGLNEEISSDEFFGFIEGMRKEYGGGLTGLSFSYPARIFEDGSAEILSFSKEIKIRGAESKIIKLKTVNDTVAVQLGTRGANMALVLGTGMNISFSMDGMIINSECGRSRDFPAEDFDFGELAEMQAGGAYLMPLIKKLEGKISARELYMRAARIAAAELFGTARYAGIEHMKIAAEGSVFYKAPGLSAMIKEALDSLCCSYEFLDGRNKNLIGAAAAALI